MTKVVVKSGTVYEYVIYVQDHKLANVVQENMLQQMLRECRSIGQSKGQTNILEEPDMCIKAVFSRLLSSTSIW